MNARSKTKIAIASFSAPQPMIEQVWAIASGEDRAFSSVIRAALNDYLTKRAEAADYKEAA